MSAQHVLHGNNLDLLARMPDCSVHAVVTDPPYGLNFMGKDWDKALPDPRTWSECLRVLRPGGHLVAFGAPRLVHRLTCQIEDAGFEVRDQLLWLFGSGFPKSLDVSKAIDSAAGAVREVVGTRRTNAGNGGEGNNFLTEGSRSPVVDITAPASPEAARWSGWGTALKPAYEPIVLARKPLDGTVAQTVQRWGTGAINVDGCRVAGEGAEAGRSRHGGGTMEGASFQMPDSRSSMPAGRWPANLILDEAAGALLDAQSDSGGASRFFARVDFGEVDRFMYCPKASRSEREAGLGHLPPRTVDPSRAEDAAGRESPRTGAGRSGESRRNHHATVKPIELMRWLVRLVTPPGGIVLEPFAGSGTTPAACALEGVDCVAMELEAEYVEIARARVAHWRTVR